MTPRGWRRPKSLTFEDWMACGRILGKDGWSWMWQIGDWWVCAEDEGYGKRKAFVESPDWIGPAYRSCVNAGYAARRIEESRRLDHLPWDHHLQAARLVLMNEDGTIKDDSAAVEALAWATLSGKACTVQEMRSHIRGIQIGSPGAGTFTGLGPYQTVVIDPAWDMEKIERDVAPNQFGLDYPTMSVGELIDFWNSQVAPRLAPDAHIFLWTTQKWRWTAESLVFPAIGLDRSMVLFTWHKNAGFQPHGLPMFNSEFVLYGRKGSAEFSDLKDFKTCFNAPRREHSRKPNEFFETVKRTCPPPRIDIFSREPHDGFEQFGNEIQKFAEPAG
jgi:N6-adenosine-specific RNA methylase IME4